MLSFSTMTSITPVFSNNSEKMIRRNPPSIKPKAKQTTLSSPSKMSFIPSILIQWEDRTVMKMFQLRLLKSNTKGLRLQLMTFYLLRGHSWISKSSYMRNIGNWWTRKQKMPLTLSKKSATNSLNYQANIF